VQRPAIPLAELAPKRFSRYENRLALQVATGLRKRQLTLLETLPNTEANPFFFAIVDRTSLNR
jgi:hypothetical protein